MEPSPSIEFFGIGLVTPLDLSVDLWASRWDVAMRDAEIGKMPGELRPKGRVVIRLDSLDSEWEMLSDLIQELHRGLGVVVIVDAQYAETRGLVDGGELIEALTRSAHTGNEFHIELHRAARNLKGSVGRLGAWAIFLQGDSANVMPVKDFQDGCWGDIRVIVPLKIQTGSNSPAAALLTNAEDEGNDLGGNAKPDSVGPPGLITKASQAVLFIAIPPDIEKRPGYTEEATGLTDVAAHALRMLQHAQPGLHLPCLNLFIDWILHLRPPAVG